MTPEMFAGAGLVPLATARTQDSTPSRRIPSLYADAASWTVLRAVDELWAGAPERVRAAADRTAMVLVSTYSTIDTMAALARAVPSGRLSPLRFAGASAGGPVSLAAQVHGFRGPTLVVTTRPEDGYPLALTMARHWLRAGAAGHVVVAAHEHDPDGGHRVRCAVVSGASR